MANLSERTGVELTRTIRIGGKVEYSLNVVMGNGTRFQRKTSQFLNIVRNASKGEADMLGLPILTHNKTLEEWAELDRPIPENVQETPIATSQKGIIRK